MANRVYAGRSVATRRERVVYACPCGERYGVEVWRAVDARDEEPAARLVDGRLNHVRCPSCEAGADVQVPVVFHDGEKRQLVLVLPDGLRHRELAERAAFYTALAADEEPAPDYVLDALVVFGASGLRAALAPRTSEELQPVTAPVPAQPAVRRAIAAMQFDDDKRTPGEPHDDDDDDADITSLPTQIKAVPVPSHAAPSALEKLPTLPSLRDEETPLPHAIPWLSPAQTTKVPVKTPINDEPTSPGEERREDSQARVVSVPDPRAAVTERWIAGREGPSAFVVADEVLLCASLPQAALEAFLPGHVELRAQLHRLPSYPLLSLTLLAHDHAPGGPPGQPVRPRPEEMRLLCVPLDIARAAHRVVLEALGRRCALTLELFDSQYLPVVAHRVTAPLEENVRRLVSEAKDALERLAPATRSFDRARAQFLSPGYDRLGRTPIDLPDESEALDRPGLVRAALSSVSRWSEPSAEAYLVEIRSLPLPEWRALRAKVVRRALDVGVAVSRPLVERSAKEHGAPLPSWAELLDLQVKRFTEVAARLKPNDLSATEEADNWELLLRECSLAGVVIDDQVRKLAQASLRRARASSGGGVDLRALSTAELVALLEQKELRREACVILCERRETQTLPAIFAAVRKMQRNEANVVLPAVTRFGGAAERWLVDGIKSKKSFLRQGCALALGQLRTPAAIDALVKLLTAEPTEIWGEIARAVGDAGPSAVQPLAAMLREVDVDDRDRIVEALAQVAARGPARAAVEVLANSRDALVSGAAQRALARVAEVRAADSETRRGGGESTVVRGFSRRFYHVLDGDDSGGVELSPDDIEEIDDSAPRKKARRSDDDDDEDRDLVTSTTIPALLPNVNDGESTNPTPKTTLPRRQG
jgi:hypothetical protein